MWIIGAKHKYTNDQIVSVLKFHPRTAHTVFYIHGTNVRIRILDIQEWYYQYLQKSAQLCIQS